MYSNFPSFSPPSLYSSAFPNAKPYLTPPTAPGASYGGASISLNLHVMLQASQSLNAGWGGFAGGAGFAMGGYGYGAAPSFGGYGAAAGYGAFGYGGTSGYGAAAGYGAFGYGGTSGYGATPGYAFGQSGFYADLNLQFGYRELPGETQKMWDVWFDSKDGQKTVQRSPIVLDLNKNGKADITGKNITGDGKIDGPTVLFDIDPNNVSFQYKSQQRRPGSGAPAVSGGYWVDPNGNKVKSGPPKGTQPKYNGYRYLDKNGQLVGEMKDGLYHYGKQERREITEWLAKDGGDGFLVADLDGDGQISSALELFGTDGADGQKYANGFEKLAALYDRNRDGRIEGDELAGLQVWVDSNADGKVQDGELQSLQSHGITSFNVGYDAQTMEGSYTTGGGQMAPYFHLNAVFGGYGYGSYGQVQQPAQGWGGGYPAAAGY